MKRLLDLSGFMGLVAAGVLFSGAVFAQQQTVFLNPVKDATLFDSATGATSAGGGPTLFSGNSSTGSRRRSVLQFDLSSIPQASVINQVVLHLIGTNNPNSTPRTINLHRVTALWGEQPNNVSQAGGPSVAGDVTWIHTFYPGTLWSTAGGDFDPTVHSTLTNGFVSGGTYDWVSDANQYLEQDVQDWLANPSTNFGWILVGTETTNQTVRGFGSRESTSVPVLEIHYTDVTGVEDLGIGANTLNAFPNPFRSLTNISFSLTHANTIQLAVFDVTGRKVAILGQGLYSAGKYKILWNGRSDEGRSVSPGTYLIRMSVRGGASKTARVVHIQ